MKKIILTILMAVGITSAQAQTLTATLQQGDVVTPFYGENAFRNAFEAAQDGAVITLSPGAHLKPNASLDINKSITLIGSGAFGEDEAISYVNELWVKVDNVRIEGLYFQNRLHIVDWANNARILHCYISVIGGNDHNNTIVDQCVIKQNDIRYGGFTNYCIKNSTILESGTGTGNTTFINDVIIIPYGDCGKDTYRNCVLGIDYDYGIDLDSPGEYYNNVFFNTRKKDEVMQVYFKEGCVNSGNTIDTYENLFGGVFPSKTMAVPNTTTLGDDGKKVGPEGGSGYKLYPAIPRIISKSIDRQTDADGKIKVNIQVKAEE